MLLLLQFHKILKNHQPTPGRHATQHLSEWLDTRSAQHIYNNETDNELDFQLPSSLITFEMWKQVIFIFKLGLDVMTPYLKLLRFFSLFEQEEVLLHDAHKEESETTSSQKRNNIITIMAAFKLLL